MHERERRDAERDCKVAPPLFPPPAKAGGEKKDNLYCAGVTVKNPLPMAGDTGGGCCFERSELPLCLTEAKDCAKT